MFSELYYVWYIALMGIWCDVYIDGSVLTLLVPVQTIFSPPIFCFRL